MVLSVRAPPFTEGIFPMLEAEGRLITHRRPVSRLPPALAHNPTYARHTPARGLAASLAALRSTFSVFGAMASKPTVSRLPHLRRLPHLSQRGSSTFRRVAGHLRPLVGGHRQLPVCHHVWPDKVRKYNMTINDLVSPAHGIDHLDDIYRSVEALIESIDERDSDLAVALQYEDQCPLCFRQALLHVVELLSHCGTTAVAVDMAQQHRMTCLQEGLLPATAMDNLIAL